MGVQATLGTADAIDGLIQLGWPVLPLCWPDDDGKCACGGGHEQAGKAPLLPDGYKGASLDRARVAGWWRRWPRANVGIDIARAGLVVVDADSDDAVDEVLELWDIAPETPWVETGKGRHWYFKAPDGAGGRYIRKGYSQAIDILAEGYVVAPPSRHRSGVTYRYGHIGPPTPLPRAASNHMVARTQASTVAGGSDDVTPYEGEDLPPGATAFAVEVWRGERWSKRPDGGNDRSRTMYFLACELVEGGMTDAGQIASILAAWDIRNDGKYHSRRDFGRRCMEDAGRALASTRPRQHTVAFGADDDRADAGSVVGPTGERVSRDYAQTLAYLEAHPNTLHTAGAWFEYQAGSYTSLTGHDISARVHKVLGAQSRSSTIASVRTVLAAHVNMPEDAWMDAPEVLVLQNGTLELRPDGDVRFREHRPEDLARTRLPYEYDARARSEQWVDWLQGRFHPDTVGWVQEFAGYGLSRDVSHEIAMWLFGPPGGGKSTFIAGIEAMLGPERCGRLSLADISRSRFALSSVPGKTLLVASEQPTKYVDCSDTLNAMISGDTILIERKYLEPYAHRPTAKILWAMNTLPLVGSSVDGIFRRVKIVRMDAIEAPDHSVRGRVIGNPAGILTWAIEGWQRLVSSRQRLHERAPADVVAQTQAFEMENDHVRLFVEECLVENPRGEVQSSAIDDAYQAWTVRRGIRTPIYYTKRAEHYRRCGLPEAIRTRRGNVYRGWELRFD